MILNEKQKQFLFKNLYITAKVLDACVEDGWQHYFKTSFKWQLVKSSADSWHRVVLFNKRHNTIEYDIGVNFQNNDYEQLMKLN